MTQSNPLSNLIQQLMAGMRQTNQVGGGKQPSLLSQGATSGGVTPGANWTQSPPSLNTPDQSGQQSYIQALLARGLPGGGQGQNPQSNAAPNASGAGQEGMQFPNNSILQRILQAVAQQQSSIPMGAQTTQGGSAGYSGAPAGQGGASPATLQALFQQMSQQHAASSGPPVLGGGSTPATPQASQFPWWLNMNRPTS